MSFLNNNRITNELSTTLEDGVEYYLTDVSNLVLSYPESPFECFLQISFSENEPLVFFPESNKFIGEKPIFNGGEIWELSIKNGVTIAWRVE